MVMSAVTGSPCLVRISIPEPIILMPMNVPMPKAKTISVPTILTLRDTPKKYTPMEGKLLLLLCSRQSPKLNYR